MTPTAASVPSGTHHVAGAQWVRFKGWTRHPLGHLSPSPDGHPHFTDGNRGSKKWGLS